MSPSCFCGRPFPVNMLVVLISIGFPAVAAFAQPAETQRQPRLDTLSRARQAHSEKDLDQAITLYEEVLKNDPDNDYANANVADLYLYCRRINRLAEVVERVVKARPNSAKSHALHAAVLLDRGDYDIAIEAWDRARELSPTDRVIDLDIDITSPEPAGMEEAREQLRMMGEDLPGLLDDVSEEDPLYQWTVRRMAGQGLGFPVIWNSEEPASSDADHRAPHGGQPGFIRVSRTRKNSRPVGEPMTIDHYWSCIVFELFNIANTEDFANLMKEVEQGKMRRQYYVRACVNLEGRASVLTRAFYAKVYLPHCKDKQIPTQSTDWFGESWHAPYETLEDFGDDESDYPWSVFGRAYDYGVIGALKKERAWDEALAAINRILRRSDKLEPQYEYPLLVSKGYILHRQGYFGSAIRAYSDALSVKPNDYLGHVNRASAYLANGQVEEAMKDVEAAQQRKPDDRKWKAIMDAAERMKPKPIEKG